MKQRDIALSTHLHDVAKRLLRGSVCTIAKLLALLLFALITPSCGDEELQDEILDDIAQAEKIAESDPDTAFEIMRSIDRSLIEEEADRARYALIFSEVCYYRRMFVDVDSLSSIAEAYYSEGDNHALRARALFQHGYVMYNAHKYPEAMISLLGSEQSLAKCDNSHLRGVVHRTKGDIYHYGGLYQNSYDSYDKARQSFELSGLPYHTIYAKYNMARAATMMRDFDRAESLFTEAGNYAIENDDKDFLCVVLHELCEMYLLENDYEKCAEVIELFKRYDCAKWLMSHYHAICAIVELMAHNDIAAAHRELSIAENDPQRDEETIEKARYIIYRKTGNDSKALECCEELMVRQSAYMHDILSQPVLNYQIDLLHSELEREEQEREAYLRERSLSRQRNITIYISLFVFIIMMIAYARIRIAQKDRDIANYVAMIDELQLTRSNVSQPMADAIDRLYDDRLKDLNRLCETFYEHSDTSRQASKVFEEVRLTIEAIKSDKERINELERLVNSCRGNLMSKLREQCPKLNGKELRVALYSYAGFSARAISVFVDSNPVALSKIKYRMKTKIKEAGGEDADMLISNLIEH